MPLEDLPAGACPSPPAQPAWAPRRGAGPTTPFSAAAESAIFLEFKHYKPRKNKVSVKCFSLLELDELVTSQSPVPLEMYVVPCGLAIGPGREKRETVAQVGKA
jgi:hypothetical protein